MYLTKVLSIHLFPFALSFELGSWGFPHVSVEMIKTSVPTFSPSVVLRAEPKTRISEQTQHPGPECPAALFHPRGGQSVTQSHKKTPEDTVGPGGCLASPAVNYFICKTRQGGS